MHSRSNYNNTYTRFPVHLEVTVAKRARGSGVNFFSVCMVKWNQKMRFSDTWESQNICVSVQDGGNRIK